MVGAEQRVVARMDSEAPGRLLYERSLATVDVTVGSLLGASELEERGATLAERSDALRKAAELDASAKGKVRRAEQEFKAKRDEAMRQREGAKNATQQAFKDARNQAEERKRSTAQAARKRAAEVKQRVDKTAAARTNAVETAKRSEQSQIKAAEQQATKAAQAKLAGKSACVAVVDRSGVLHCWEQASGHEVWSVDLRGQGRSRLQRCICT